MIRDLTCFEGFHALTLMNHGRPINMDCDGYMLFVRLPGS